MACFSSPVHANESHHARKAHHGQSGTAHHEHAVNNAEMFCKMHISPKEDREIIIMKLQQRMDCLEAKVNESSNEIRMLRDR